MKKLFRSPGFLVTLFVILFVLAVNGYLEYREAQYRMGPTCTELPFFMKMDW